MAMLNNQMVTPHYIIINNAIWVMVIKSVSNVKLKVVLYYTGWWFQPLWNILVSWDYYSQYVEK